MTERVIEFRPRPRQRVFIKLSGGRSFTIPASEAHSLEVGSALSEADVGKLSRLDQYFRGKEKAIRLLSIRSRSCHEIRIALDTIGIDASIRNGILQELEDLGIIDDERFTREYVRTKIDVKKLGPHRLKYQLAKLGIKVSIIDTVLKESFSGDVQETLAWELIHKKISQRKPDEKAVRRLSAMLRRKGFDYEVVNRVSYALLKQSGRDVDPE